MSLPRKMIYFSYFYLICMIVAAAHLSNSTEVITELPESTTTSFPETYSTPVDLDVSTTDASTTTSDDYSSFTFVTDGDLFMTTSIPKNEETTTEEVPEQTTKVTTTERPKNDISNITCLPDCDTLSPDDKMDIEKLTEILQSIRKDTEKDWRVVDVGVTDWSDSTLSVSWKPPNDTANIVQAYVVEWYTQNSNHLVGACRSSNETQNITIPGLNTCKIYEIHVIPATSERLGEQKVAVESTGLIVGNDTLNLQVAENGTNWLKIKWTVVSHDCITKTLVTYCDRSQCKNEAVNTTSFNATDLLPCTEYNFTVAFSTNGRELGSASMTAATEFLPPGKPSPAWTLAGDKNLTIFWTPPEGYTCVQFYSVSLSLGITITNTTNNTQITFEGLRSCSIYNVTITPMPQLYTNSTEVISSNKTFAPVPISPLLEGKPSLTSHQAIFSWRLPLDNLNNCEDTNIFTQCNFTDVLGEGYSGSNSSKSVNITAGSVVHVTNVAIDNLSPFTQYNCHSVASNSRGVSSISKTVFLRTLEDVPSEPFIDVYNITDKNFTLVWKKPKYIPGNITSFEINFSWFFKFHQPEPCKKMNYNTEKILITDGSTFLRTITDGVPYSQYTAKVKAMTAAGWGNSSENKSFYTAAGAPGPVSNLTFVINENPFDKNILDSSLAWGMPCLINAERIDYFNITWLGHRLNYPSHFLSERMYNEDGTCPGDNCTRKVMLREEYTYTFWVYGKAKDYAGLGEGTSTTATFPAGIPPLPDENYIQQITIDPYKSRRTTTSATILLPIFPNTYGDIRCYAIMVAGAGYNNGSFSRINLSVGQWPEAASWRESMLMDFKIPYQAAKFCDNRCLVDYGKLEAVKFVIGEDSETCPELSEKHEKSYCNGPLKPDTWYDVRIRAFTNGGYRDSTIFKVKTNAELRVAIVVGTIFGILFLGILTTIMLLIRKCSLQAFLRRFLHSDMPGSPVPAPFNRRKFIAHCQQLADNPGKLSNEFQLLSTLSVDLQMPTNAACLQANRKKNRYTDILPYDFSRVKLDPIDNDPNSDYINASFIKGFSSEEEYIACQGPKEDTTQDFWRMIDQYDVKLIVMLTQLVEKNKEKCHQYYPTIRETFNYENMCIRCTSELDYRTYTQRTLILQKENEKRTITHLHFKDWPDHDVPEDFDAMVNFCQMMRRHVVANRGLAVVHCSAGIGRTGTLIAIDILLQHIKENRKLDVFGTVYRLRHHRINMVQRESQYAYIYNCIRQVLKNPYFSKSYKPPSVDPVTDNANNNKMGSSMTNLVSSMETLKKSSLLSSSSVQSADGLCDNLSLSLSSSSSTSSTDKSACGPLLHGLRNSKSTSAIYCKPARYEFVRYSTQDFSKLHENTCTIQLLEDQTGDHNSNKSIYDNFDSAKNFKCHSDDEDDDNDNDTAAQKLLDTSV